MIKEKLSVIRQGLLLKVSHNDLVLMPEQTLEMLSFSRGNVNRVLCENKRERITCPFLK